MENEETDIKPLLDISESNTAKPSNSNNSTITKKWSPGSWQDGNRQSAFQPYKQQQQQTSLCTVLTNLQRGNTQADTPVPQSIDINFHTRAGKGEITQEYIRKEKCIDLLDNNDLTPLHWAAAYGQTNSVQLLLLNGAQIDQIGPEGETPLLLAANGGHHDIVKILINKKADVNKVDDVCLKNFCIHAIWYILKMLICF